MLRFARERGYRVVIVRIVACIDDVKVRIFERQKDEVRYTPLDYVDARARTINELLPGYRAVADSYAEFHNQNSYGVEQAEFFSGAAIATKDNMANLFFSQQADYTYNLTNY